MLFRSEGERANEEVCGHTSGETKTNGGGQHAGSAAAASKEILDPSEQEGEKILLSGLLDGFFVLAEGLNRRRG